MRTALAAATAALFALAGAAQAKGPAPAGAPDYTQPSAWVCSPGSEEFCTKDLDAVAIDAQGNRTAAPFIAAADPPIDCFYVYPTVSKQPTDYADMTADAEVVRAAHGQAGRFASRCRLFAPIYRQMTLTVLMRPPGMHDTPPSFEGPYRDVRDAWRSYLAHDNHGRGVVLIGHSQGTILLQRLLAEEIDGKPDQKLLVSALLGGDPQFGLPPGKDVGGTLKSIPVCRAKDQIGCVVVWADYAADDPAKPPVFGRIAEPGQVGACVNPAAPGGGKAPIKAYVHKPATAPAEDPPYVEAVGQMSAECVADPTGATLRVTIEPGRYAEALHALFTKSAIAYYGWGLHVLDYSLPQGDLIDMVGAQSEAWVKTHPK